MASPDLVIETPSGHKSPGVLTPHQDPSGSLRIGDTGTFSSFHPEVPRTSSHAPGCAEGVLLRGPRSGSEHADVPFVGETVPRTTPGQGRGTVVGTGFDTSQRVEKSLDPESFLVESTPVFLDVHLLKSRTPVMTQDDDSGPSPADSRRSRPTRVLNSSVCETCGTSLVSNRNVDV